MIKKLKNIFLTTFVIGTIFLGYTNAGCIVQSSSDSHNMTLCDNNNLSYYYSGNNYFIGGISDSKLNFNDGIFKYDVPEVGNVLSYWWGLGSLNYTIKNYYGNGSSNGTINGFYYFNGAVGNDPLTLLSSRNYDFYTFDKLRNYLDNTYKYVDYYCAISNYDSNPYCIVCLTQGTNSGHICIDRSNSTYNSNNFITVDQILNESKNNPFTDKATGNQQAKINTPCPKIGQLMANAGKQYNTGLCYNNTLYYNGTNFETIEKKDIFTIFDNNYETYINRVSIYRNSCRAPATQQTCGDAFTGEYEKFSIISNAINNGAEEKTLRNYCNMGLNYDPNATTCVASGRIKEPYTNQELIESVINKEYEIWTPGTGTVFDTIMSGNNTNRDIRESMKNIYGKLTGLFESRSGKNGIIPDYILWICFLTILFTVIFKK